MMIKAKSIISTLLAIAIFTCFMFMSIYATSATVSNSPPTGNSIEQCPVVFKVGYIPSGDSSFTGDIAVTLTDIATNNEYQFLLSANKAYNANETYSIIANTTYKVTAICRDTDKFIVVNADGTLIDSYAATTAGLYFDWEITDNTYVDVNNSAHGENAKDSPVVASGASDIIKEFYQKTSFIAKDKDYKTFLGNWAGATYKTLYMSEKGNTEESWNALTLYDRACYSLLYTYPKSCILGGNNSIYAKDRATFIKNLELAKQGMTGLKDNDIVYKALVDAWDWHWTNWEGKYVFVNPFEGVEFGLNDLQEGTYAIDPGNSDTITTSVNTRKELASPRNFLSILKQNFVTLFILIAVGIYLMILTYKSRKNSYSDKD